MKRLVQMAIISMLLPVAVSPTDVGVNDVFEEPRAEQLTIVGRIKAVSDEEIRQMITAYEADDDSVRPHEYIRLLALAGREEESAKVAESLFQSACSEVVCTDDDHVFFQGFILALKNMSTVRQCGDGAKCYERVAASIFDAVAIMDKLPVDYRVPNSVQEAFNIRSRVPAIDVRTKGAVMLLELGDESGAFKLAQELVGQCPVFESKQVCYEYFCDLERKFIAKQSSLNGVVQHTEPSGFDAGRWREGDVSFRGRVAEDLAYSGYLMWKTRADVLRILGPPTSNSGTVFRYTADIAEKARQLIFIEGEKESIGSLRVTFDPTDRVVAVSVHPSRGRR